MAAAAVFLLLEPYGTFLIQRMPFNTSDMVKRESATSLLIKQLEAGNNPPRRLFGMIDVARGDWPVIHEGAQGNVAMAAGIHDSTGYNPSMLRRYKEIMGVDFLGWPVSLSRFFDENNRAMDLLASRYISYDAGYILPFLYWRHAPPRAGRG